MEKNSEIEVRKALVNKIKKSGLKDIEEAKVSLKELIADLNLENKGDYAYFDSTIRELTALNYLKEYLSRDTMFAYEYADADGTIYVIPLQSLEIWLEAGVVRKYLSYIDADRIEPCWLTDDFFGFKSGFISIFEKMVYERKQNKGEES